MALHFTVHPNMDRRSVLLFLGHRTPRASLWRVPCVKKTQPQVQGRTCGADARDAPETQLCAPPTPSFVPRDSAQTALTLQQGPAQGDVVHTRLQVRHVVVCGARRPGPRDNAVCGERTKDGLTRSSESGARRASSSPSRVSPPSRRLRRGVIGTLAPRLPALRHLPRAVPARDVPVARHRHQRDSLEHGDEHAKL